LLLENKKTNFSHKFKFSHFMKNKKYGINEILKNENFTVTEFLYLVMNNLLKKDHTCSVCKINKRKFKSFNL